MKGLWFLVFVALLLGLAASAYAKYPDGGDPAEPTKYRPMVVDNETNIDGNNIEMVVTNHGSFSYDLINDASGLWFPKGTDKTAVYASGLWIGCKVNGEVRVTAGSYTQEYRPGPIIDREPADWSLGTHRVYKAVRGKKTYDYYDWAEAAQYGAPSDTIIDGTETRIVPRVLGDQMLWCVYNDADPDVHKSDEGRTPPLGVEIQQTTFAFDWKGALGNVVFVKFKVINKGWEQELNTLEDVYFSVWSDPDVGDASDDYVGCDTTLNVGYAYNATNTDAVYAARVPCVGYDFFLGPVIRDPDTHVPIDTLGMSSFNKYINGTDPRATAESYNYMRGLDLAGNPVTDCNGNVTTFMVSGDPVAGKGCLDNDPADRRFMINTGPFTMAPGDTQEVVVGIIVGQGTDRLSAVRAMKFYDRTAQVAFDKNFDLPIPPATPSVEAVALDDEVRLSWTPASEVEQGDYTFEGYNVYQSPSVSAAGPWNLIATYDIVNGLTTVQDTVVDINFGVQMVEPVQYGLDAGLKRYIVLDQDKVTGLPIVSGTPYYFRVGAYSYTASPEKGLPNTLESQSDIIRVVPQEPAAGTVLTKKARVTHLTEDDATPSDEYVSVEIVDPFALTGHQYKIVYEPSDPPDVVKMLSNAVPVNFDYHWKLIDQTAGTTLFEDGKNRNGDDDYPVIDGFVARVMLDVPIGRADFLGPDGNPSDVLTGARPPFRLNINDGGDYAGFAYGRDYLGSSYSIVDSFYVFPNVEITFSKTQTQKAYRYERFEGFDGNIHIEYLDFVTVPFIVRNADTGDTLNASFMEWSGEGGAFDGEWMPTADPDLDYYGGRELLFVNPTKYVEAGGVYDNSKSGIQTDPLYILWLRRMSEADTIADNSKMVISRFIPSTDKDYFTFETTARDYDGGAANSALKEIRVVPNPYFSKSAYELNQFDHVVKFNNLPAKCTVRIFNLAGDLIRTLEKDNANTSILEWNLFNEKGIPVSSGLYIYHVDAPEVGSVFGKMAIILEKERLNTF